MDFKSNSCHICQNNAGTIEFSCRHHTCDNCIYKIVIHNQEQMIEDFNRLKNNELKCPLCNKGITQKNKHELLTRLNEANEKRDLTICQKHEEKEEFFCKSCKIMLCLKCLEEHRDNNPKHKVTNDHEELELSCTKHNTIERKQYHCITCKLNICKLCREEGHRSHNVQPLEAVMNDQIGKIRSEFTWRSPEEIEAFLGNIFDPYRRRTEENFTKFYSLCNEISEIIDYLVKQSKNQYHQFVDNVETTQELMARSYKKYLYDMLTMSGRLQYFDFKLKEDRFITKEFLMDRISESMENLKKEFKIHEETVFKNDIFEKRADRQYKCAQVLDKHSGYVYVLIILKDGRVVSSSGDKTIKVYDPYQNFKCTFTLHGHNSDVRCIMELPDGRIISGSGDRNILIWDLSKGDTHVKILAEHNRSVLSFALINDNQFISGSSDRTIRTWDINNDFKLLLTINAHEGDITDLLALKNKNIASCSNDKNIKIWDPLFNCLQILQGHTACVYKVIQLDDDRLVSASWDSTMKVWQNNNGHYSVNKVIEGHSREILSLINLRDGNMASGSADKSIKIWDVKNDFKILFDLQGYKSAVFSLLNLWDGRLLSGSGSNIKIWK
jgi:hypothetical protein